MRVGIVRTDLGNGIYFADLRSNVQRPVASSAPGQAMTIRRPTDVELGGVLGEYAILSLLATNTSASVDTSSNDTLRIRQSTSASFVVIAVTSGASTAKTVIVDDLNAAFVANSFDLVASIAGTNQIQIDSTSTNMGPGSYVGIDTVANGSTLSTAVGYSSSGVTAAGLTVSALQTAVYPTSSTIDVSSATISALSTFSDMDTTSLAALVEAIADAVAPHIVETGPAMLSFAHGSISKARAAAFQPHGYPAGIGVAVVENDGTTALTYMGQ